MLTDSLFSQVGKEILITEIKVIWTHKIVVALSFLIPIERNLEQWKMVTEEQEQEERWQHERATWGDQQDNGRMKWTETRWSKEMKAPQS